MGTRMKACVTHVQMAAFLNPSLGRRKHILKHRITRRGLLLIGREAVTYAGNIIRRLFKPTEGQDEILNNRVTGR